MIEQLRKQWNGQDVDHDISAAALGGRAQGRVALWAVERLAAILHRSSRSRFEVNLPGADHLTRHEHALVAIVNALHADEQDRAQMHAQWLVRGDAVTRLLRCLGTLIEIPKVAQVTMRQYDASPLVRTG